MLQKLYTWYGRRTVWGVLVVILIISAIGVAKLIQSNQPDAAGVVVDTTPLVKTATVAELGGTANLSFVGTVESLDRAVIESETSGRVTDVRVAIGDTVQAGTILIQLENASEAAAVLQAEGSYEAALAAAAQSDVSITEAEQNVQVADNNITAARNTIVDLYRDAYTTTNNIVRSTIDQFFANPDNRVPGVRIDSLGNTDTLNSQRVSLQTILPAWRDHSNQLTIEADLETALSDAEANIKVVLSMVDIFIAAIPEADPNEVFTESVLDTALTNQTNARNQLIGLLSNISAQRTNLKNAEESKRNAESALERAKIAGRTTEVSAADAQVKQALGSLRSAQANLAKTIIRSPITGTVNKVNVKTGDFISSFEEVAIVANNDALEISIFVGESDLPALAIGDEVSIEGTATGTITNIAPAVDPATRKSEVKVATESTTLKTGDTVTITLDTGAVLAKENAPLLVPLTAVKFTADAGSIFVVSNENTLTPVPVTIGPISGSFVTLTSGIDQSTEFVIDARGLAAGQTVSVMKNN